MFKKRESHYALAMVIGLQLLFSVSDVAAACPPESLRAYYAFSGTADDTSGNGNHGTVNGATLTADRFGNPDSAYSFDGDDDYIDIGNSSSLNIGTSDYTISAWIRTVEVVNDGRIFSKGSSSCTVGYMMRMGGNESAKAYFENAHESVCRTELVGATSINDGAWHFVVGVADRSVGSRIYIDGRLDSVDSFATSEFNLDNSRQAKIGINDVNMNEDFKGEIDELCLHARALSWQEILALFDSGDVAALVFADGFESGDISAWQ